ncbi:MAG TPA: HAMP domain-containing sensor histidine kinase [Pirellulales bacterium]|nr:HAMP domain-containing sensor histidine kinase [Pirellulales bacterium]
MDHESICVLRVDDETPDQRNPSRPSPRASPSQFADGLSHDIRTPLTVIREFASIMREGLGGPVTERQQQYLAIIIARVDDLTLTVDDLLDASALDAGLLNLWRRKIQPSEMIDRVRKALELRAEARRIDVEIALDEPLPAVYCDAEKIVRAIVHLAAYAFKVEPVGGRIRLWAKRCANGQDVLFGVSGASSTAADTAATCEPFPQLGWDADTSFDRFGLGLNVARELVHVNLGALRVYGEAGAAVAFALTLPADEPLQLFSRYLDFVLAGCGSPARPCLVALLTAEIDPGADAKLLSAADGFLHAIVSGGELVYRFDDRHWALAVRRQPEELNRLAPRIEREWTQFSENRPAGTPPALSLNSLGSWRADRGRGALVAAFAAAMDKLAGEQGPSEIV